EASHQLGVQRLERQVEVRVAELAGEGPADVVLAGGAQLDERLADPDAGGALVLERGLDLLGADDAGLEQDVGDRRDARTDDSHASLLVGSDDSRAGSVDGQPRGGASAGGVSDLNGTRARDGEGVCDAHRSVRAWR